MCKISRGVRSLVMAIIGERIATCKRQLKFPYRSVDGETNPWPIDDLIERQRGDWAGRAISPPPLGTASPRGAPAAHDIPTDVKINAFVKPDGHQLELLIRVPLAAMLEVDFPPRGPGYLDLSRADDALRNAAKLYLTDNIDLYEDDAPLPPPRSSTRACRCRPTARSRRTSRRARTWRSRRWPTISTCTGTRSCSTCCSNIRSGPTAPNSRSVRASSGSASSVSTVLRFLPPGRRDARVRVPRRSRPRAPRSALAPGRAALRRVRLLAHPRRHRPPAVPALPGDPVPAAAAADADRHVVHRRRIRSR